MSVSNKPLNITVKFNWKGDLIKDIDIEDIMKDIAEAIKENIKEKELSGGEGKIQKRTGTLYNSIAVRLFEKNKFLVYTDVYYAPFVMEKKYDFMEAGIRDSEGNINSEVKKILDRIK